MKAFFKNIISLINRNKHKIFTFTVGLAFIVFICFVAVTLVNRVYRVFVPDDIYADPNYVKHINGASVYETVDGEEYAEGSEQYFENYLSNFIKQDTPYFKEPLDLDDEYIISFGIWQAITLNNSQGIYTYDKKGNFRVPASDVEMFSFYCLDYPEKIKHATVDLCGKFKYNPLNKTYTVPSSGVHEYLVPDVVKIDKGEDDTYQLIVDYYKLDLISSENLSSGPQNFVRRVKITMQDMGIQSYNVQTGTPISRYMIQSLQPVTNEENDIEKQTETTDKIDLN